MCALCINVILSVPSWTIKWEHFQNEKHMELFNWPISLAYVCGFFHSKNQWKGKKCYLVRHAYCRTECCTNCHCPSTRSKTALLFLRLIAPLQRIHVQYTPLYFWIQSVRYILHDVETLVHFCGNICFAKQVAFTEGHDWLKLQWAFTIQYLLCHYFYLYLCKILAFLPPLTLY